MKPPGAQQRASAATRLFWLASAMFFLSGGTGLAYQVIWFKRFAHVWGSSSLAFASVGASFLFGLGVGAYWFGRYADRAARPLRWYGWCELAIGVLALVIPFEIQFLITQSAGFYARLPEDPLLRYLLQFVVTAIVVGPPCMLMGGTLPLLIRELTARDGAIDQATGWLYAINTFGAAAGCLLTGFHLLPMHGLQWANNLAAGLNLSIGLAALVVSRNQPVRLRPKGAKTTVPSEAVVASPSWNFPLLGLYVAVTLSGLAALVLEMTWSRQLALVLGGSTYAYSATLFVVLLGIATGSLLFHLGLRRVALRPWLPIVVIGMLAASCLAGHWLLPQMAKLVGQSAARRGTLWGNAEVCVLASLTLELLPAVAMGILFPLFVDLSRASAARVGRMVGNIYAWNTFGSIAGASLTAVLLFPTIGTAGSIALAVAAYVLTLLLVLPWHSLRAGVVAIGCGAAGAAIVVALLATQDPRRTNMGMYMYPDATEKFEFLQPVYFVEGASSNVLVTRPMGLLPGDASTGALEVPTDTTSLRVNGKVDASDGADMLTQLGLAYFPRLFQPDARDVLVIGFGSGTTSGASLLFPDTRVTCCEIEPAVYAAADFFSKTNHRPQEQSRQFLTARNASLPADERLSDAEIDRQARFQIVFGDGRTTLQGSDQSWDLIISEPSNPWLAGVSNLFTREFFQAAKTHLKPGGVLAQWVQTYKFTLSDYLMIVRTLRSEFPHVGLMVMLNGTDTVLLASEQPLLPQREGLARLQQQVEQTPELRADFTKWFGTTDLRLVLLRFYLVDEPSLDRMVAAEKNGELNTDLNLRLEFLAPLHLYTEFEREATVGHQLYALRDPSFSQRLAGSLGVDPLSGQFDLVLGWQQQDKRDPTAATACFEKAVSKDPSLLLAYRSLAELSIQNKKPADAVVALRGVARLAPDEPDTLLSLVEQLMLAGQETEAFATLDRLIAVAPERLDASDSLFSQLRLSQGHASALRLFERIAAALPEQAWPQGALGEALITLDRGPEALGHLHRALALRPRLASENANVLWANNLAWLLATHPDASVRNGSEAVRWAEQVCEATQFKVPQFVDTLAVAYAEAGKFDQAARYAAQYIEQLERAGHPTGEINDAKARLKLFRSEQPFHEAAK